MAITIQPFEQWLAMLITGAIIKSKSGGDKSKTAAMGQTAVAIGSGLTALSQGNTEVAASTVQNLLTTPNLDPAIAGAILNSLSTLQALSGIVAGTPVVGSIAAGWLAQVGAGVTAAGQAEISGTP